MRRVAVLCLRTVWTWRLLFSETGTVRGRGKAETPSAGSARLAGAAIVPLAGPGASAYTLRRSRERTASMAQTTEQGEERKPSKKGGRAAGPCSVPAALSRLVVLAALALVLTAAVSLVLPLAVRRVVDGFSANNAALLDQYFAAALVIAALLALGTGLRYYLVTRLGERVVADIRRALFDRVVGLSPAFFERIMTGEVLSRLTTDTTLILSVIGSSVSVALRNLLILVGGHRR